MTWVMYDQAQTLDGLGCTDDGAIALLVEIRIPPIAARCRRMAAACRPRDDWIAGARA
jgi:hypothetical protein